MSTRAAFGARLRRTPVASKRLDSRQSDRLSSHPVNLPIPSCEGAGSSLCTPSAHCHGSVLDDYPATRRANHERLDVLIQLLNLGGVEVRAQREYLLRRGKCLMFAAAG